MEDRVNSDRFTFEPAEFVPFRDTAVLERMRRIGPEEIVRHDNPDFRIRIVPDNMVQHMWVTKIFHLIVKAREEERRCVLITPNPNHGYIKVAHLINTFGIEDDFLGKGEIVVFYLLKKGAVLLIRGDGANQLQQISPFAFKLLLEPDFCRPELTGDLGGLEFRRLGIGVMDRPPHQQGEDAEKRRKNFSAKAHVSRSNG